MCALSRILGITGIEGGFPHSEIRGSKLVRSSPRLIAAYHVLHRLSAPRHPPDTLMALDRSHYRCPSRAHPPRQRTKRYPVPSIRKKQARTRSKDQFCFKHTRERRSGCVHCWLCSLRVRPSKAGKPEGPQDNWGPIATTGYVHSSRCQISARLVDSTRHEAVWMDEIPRRRAFSAGLLEARCWSQQSNQLADCVGIALRDAIKPAGEAIRRMVEPDGIEPTTSSLQS